MQNILRFAVKRIRGLVRDHHSDLICEINRVPDLNSLRAGKENMMHSLPVFLFCHIFDTVEVPVLQNVDLVRCLPVMNEPFKSAETGLRKSGKSINGLSIQPAIIMIRQLKRHVEMIQRHHRLNAIFLQFQKNISVEFNPLFIGNLFCSCGKEAGPRN